MDNIGIIDSSHIPASGEKEVENKMKSTGIVRRVDELGRVVIPIELRRTLGIHEKDNLEIFVDKDQIVLKKYEAACIFCESTENIIDFKDKVICRKCVAEMPVPVSPNAKNKATP